MSSPFKASCSAWLLGATTSLPWQYSFINFLHFFRESTTWIPYPRFIPTGFKIHRFLPPSTIFDEYYFFLSVKLCDKSTTFSSLAKWDIGITKSVRPLVVDLSLLLNGTGAYLSRADFDSLVSFVKIYVFIYSYFYAFFGL